jgi:hypothetical protein
MFVSCVYMVWCPVYVEASASPTVCLIVCD